MKADFLKNKAIYSSGLLWAWGYLIHFAGPSGSVDASLFVWRGFSDVAFLVAMLASCLLVVLFLRHSSDLTLRRISDFGCILMIIGALSILLSSLLSIEIPWLAEFSSIFAGIGIALCGIAWGIPLSRVDSETLEKTVLGWFPVYALIFLVIAASTVGSDIANVVLGVLLVFLPILSQAGFHVVLLEARDGDHSSGNTVPSDDFSNNRRLFLTMLLYLLLVFGSLSFVWSAFSSQKGLDFGLLMLMFSAGVILLLLITWISLNRTKRFGLLTLYRWALPVEILALGLSVFNNAGLIALSYALLVAVYIGFDAMAKMLFIYVAHQHRPHAITIVGLGSAVIDFGGIAGTIAWNSVDSLFRAVGFAGTILLALFPFVLSIVLSMDQDLFLLKNPRDHMAIQGGYQHSQLEENPMLVKCRRLEELYGLTPRESEIVSLLAQGRSRTYIRELLYISKGTVDTHAYHAYAKLGIKTKDDLMKLLLDD